MVHTFTVFTWDSHMCCIRECYSYRIVLGFNIKFSANAKLSSDNVFFLTLNIICRAGVEVIRLEVENKWSVL